MRVCVVTDQKHFYEVSTPITVAQFLHSYGFSIQYPCGGNGVCGKCHVQVSGCISPAGNEEIKLLSIQDLRAGIRLACYAIIQGNCEIVLSAGNKYIRSRKKSQTTQIAGVTGVGVAIDIGTTTVAMRWHNLSDGTLLKTECYINPQLQFGADVITRLQYAENNGHTELKNSLVSLLEESISEEANSVQEYVITGNTVMLHFLNGMDTQGMTRTPFTTQSLFGYKKGNKYFPRCISAFVGADITCAVFAAKLLSFQKALLIDIGTNGEMAYWDGSTLYCCSTAAGPAFEGVGLSCGMLAEPGAICSVYIEDGVIKYNTIEDETPRGVCGSGIIDLLACMLQLDILDTSGYLKEPLSIGDSNVRITPQDVRQIQLAKAAICAGIETLCKESDRLETVLVAGEFGQYLNLENAAKIGLLPHALLKKTVTIGNAALMGAAELLCNPEMQTKTEEFATQAVTVSLAQNQEFMEQYIKNIPFRIGDK